MTFIARLRGVIEEKGRDFVVVDVGGVGYQVSVPGSTLSRLGAIGDGVTLRTYLYIREDIMQLFGFLTAEERESFAQLLGVTGIGPRSALSFLTHFSPGDLGAAVERKDAAALTRVKGIGRRTADRLLLELHGKLSASPSGGGLPPAPQRVVDDAAAALLSIGFTSAEVSGALAVVPASDMAPTEERVRQALMALDSLRT